MVFLRKFFIFILCGGIFVGLIYTIFFSTFFTVSKVSVEKTGNALPGTSLEPYLERLKGKNILFINSNLLEQEIGQTFRNEVLLVKVRKSYPRQIKIKIDEYPPVLNLRIMNGANVKRFVINQIGYAIFDNMELKNLPILILRTNREFKPKTIVIEQSRLTAIADAFKKFTDIFGMKIIDGEWMRVERELHLRTEKNFEVWLDLTADIDRQLNKLKRALARLDIYREPLEYIDLRIAGGDNERVIFKRK